MYFFDIGTREVRGAASVSASTRFEAFQEGREARYGIANGHGIERLRCERQRERDASGVGSVHIDHERSGKVAEATKHERDATKVRRRRTGNGRRRR